MQATTQSTFAQTLENYFREQLQAHAAALTPRPNDDTLWYTGNMLARFGHSKNVFGVDNGQLSLRPLALIYMDAQHTQDPNLRCLLLRQLGDLALFVGALFPENYAKRGIGKDYFIGMGCAAYDYLANHAQHSRHVFSELADMFGRLLELIARACSKQRVFDAADIVQLYERWCRSGNPHLEHQLRALGVQIYNTPKHIS